MHFSPFMSRILYAWLCGMSIARVLGLERWAYFCMFIAREVEDAVVSGGALV